MSLGSSKHSSKTHLQERWIMVLFIRVDGLLDRGKSCGDGRICHSKRNLLQIIPSPPGVLVQKYTRSPFRLCLELLVLVLNSRVPVLRTLFAPTAARSLKSEPDGGQNRDLEGEGRGVWCRYPYLNQRDGVGYREPERDSDAMLPQVCAPISQPLPAPCNPLCLSLSLCCLPNERTRAT
jgi:hypothetical protein